MAFKRNPTNDTYSQHMLPGCYTLMMEPFYDYDESISITPSTATGMQNLIPQRYNPVGSDESFLISVTRPSLFGAVIDNGNTDDLSARGIYVWEKTPSAIYYYVVVGTKVYTSSDGATWTLRHTLSTVADTPVRFTEFINSATNAKSLVMLDGVQGFVFTSDAAGTEITDVDFPTPHLPFPVYLDGYLFVAKKDTGDIYNSNLNDASAWTAGDFVSSEVYPDDIQALVKSENTLLVIGLHGSEFFYDAANAIGSPLKRIDGGTLPFGTFFPNTIAQNKHHVVLVANLSDGEPAVIKISGQKWEEVTPEFLMPRFNGLLEDITASVTGADFWGYFFRSKGDLFYCLSLGANLDTGTTFAYSLKHGVWSTFTMSTDSSYSQSNFPVTQTSMGTRSNSITFVVGKILTKPFFAKLSDSASGSSVPGADIITNLGVFGAGDIADTMSMQAILITPELTFGTLNRKTMARFGVNATLVPAVSLNTDKYITVSAYDFPKTKSLGTLNLNSDVNNTGFPFVTQLGDFRKRRIGITVNLYGYGITIFGLQCDINKMMN